MERTNLGEISGQRLEYHLEQLFEVLRIKTISGDEKYRGEIDKGAKWFAKKLADLGFESRVMETSFVPVVYGERIVDASLPTVMIYGHYDVQSPEPLGEWVSGPFEPEIRSGNIYGRGTADDKGQLYIWIAAIEEYLAVNKDLPVNVKFLIEGAEEEGSRGLSEFVADNRTMLVADICIISDSHCLSAEQPTITWGLRGLCYMEIKVKTLSFDVHSGTYGGNVLNACTVLVQMLSRLKSDKHEVLIPGFYDDVRKLSVKEQKELLEFPFGEQQIKEETGARAVVGEGGFSVQARAGARPTLDINGLWGGYQGKGAKTAIPAEAFAKVSMRLVPDQSSLKVRELFETYLKKIAPQGVEVEVTALSGAEPLLVDRGSRFFAVAETAYKEIFGKAPMYERSGGSIGVTVDLKKHLGVDSLMMGFGLPDDGLHSPNEKLAVAMFEKGIRTALVFFSHLSK